MDGAATPLRRQLSGITTRPGPLDAFKLARRQFQAGQRIEMQALAPELGINRATLYRWVGSREALIGEIVWSLAERALQGPVPEEGSSSRLAAILSHFVVDTLAHRGMRRFIDEEGEFALRLLTVSSGGVQPRMVALIRQMAAAEIAAGRLASPIPLDDLAYTLVRVIESYCYLRTITGEEPDGTRAASVLQALLPLPPDSA